jgi:hypothetical protein
MRKGKHAETQGGAGAPTLLTKMTFSKRYWKERLMRARRMSRVSLATIAAAISVAAWAAAGPSTVQAAVIAKGDRAGCTFKLTGKIAVGDTAKIEKLEFDRDQSPKLCMDSPGGSFQEGLKMAEYLDGKGLTTVVQSNASCYGACAIAFMGGSVFEDDHTYPRRALHLGGKLGFNASYLTEGDKIGRNPKQIYADGQRFVARMMMLGADMNDGVFSENIMLNILSKGENDYYMIDNVIKTRSLGIFLADVPKAKWTTQTLCYACVVAYMGAPSENGCGDADTIKLSKDVTQVAFADFTVSGFPDDPAEEQVFHCVTRFSSKTGEAWIAPKEADLSLVKDEDFKPLRDEDALPVTFKDENDGYFGTDDDDE